MRLTWSAEDGLDFVAGDAGPHFIANTFSTDMQRVNLHHFARACQFREKKCISVFQMSGILCPFSSKKEGINKSVRSVQVHTYKVQPKSLSYYDPLEGNPGAVAPYQRANHLAGRHLTYF